MLNLCLSIMLYYKKYLNGFTFSLLQVVQTDQIVYNLHPET